MNNMKITLNNKEYEFKVTIRSMIAFEQALNKRFELSSLTDIYTYMFCILLSSNEDFDIDFEQFLDLLDEEPQKSLQMQNLIFNKDEQKKS